MFPTLFIIIHFESNRNFLFCFSLLLLQQKPHNITLASTWMDKIHLKRFKKPPGQIMTHDNKLDYGFKPGHNHQGKNLQELEDPKECDSMYSKIILSSLFPTIINIVDNYPLYWRHEENTGSKTVTTTRYMSDQIQNL